MKLRDRARSLAFSKYPTRGDLFPNEGIVLCGSPNDPERLHSRPHPHGTIGKQEFKIDPFKWHIFSWWMSRSIQEFFILLIHLPYFIVRQCPWKELKIRNDLWASECSRLISVQRSETQDVRIQISRRAIFRIKVLNHVLVAFDLNFCSGKIACVVYCEECGKWIARPVCI